MAEQVMIKLPISIDVLAAVSRGITGTYPHAKVSTENPGYLTILISDGDLRTAQEAEPDDD